MKTLYARKEEAVDPLSRGIIDEQDTVFYRDPKAIEFAFRVPWWGTHTPGKNDKTIMCGTVKYSFVWI